MAFDYRSELHRYNHYYQRIGSSISKPKTAAYTMIILSLATLSFFGMFVIRPTLTTIATLQREITDNKEVNQKLDDKINALITAQSNYQAIKSNLPLLYASIPQEPSFAQLVQQIEQLAREYNAAVSSFQFQSIPLVVTIDNIPKTTITAQTAEPFTFSITLTSDYTHTKQFINRLLNISRLIIINQLDLQTISANQIEMHMQLQSFYLP